MLVFFKVENYKSFREEAILDLSTNRADKTVPGAVLRPVDISDNDAELLASAAIYGANASGKTNFIMAIEYFIDAIAFSQSVWRPGYGTYVFPNVLDSDKPTTMEAVVILNGTRYRYGFKCDRQRFTEEWLYSYPRGRERNLFFRKTEVVGGEDKVDAEFGRYLTGSSRDFKSSLRRTRSDSLFLSAMAQDNQEESLLVYRYFRDANKIIDRSDADRDINFASGFTFAIPGFRELLLGLLQTADDGIKDIQIERIEGSEEKDDDDRRGEPDNFDIKFDSTIGGTLVSLPLSVQSRGVKGIFALSAALCMSLLQGSLLIVDEIDTSMHPHLVAKIISIFQNPSTNPNSGQIIFSTHDTHLISIQHLRRDQVWFVEKADGLSTLFSLVEFSPRKDENIELSYLRGKFGGVPNSGLSLSLLGFPEPVRLSGKLLFGSGKSNG